VLFNHFSFYLSYFFFNISSFYFGTLCDGGGLLDKQLQEANLLNTIILSETLSKTVFWGAGRSVAQCACALVGFAFNNLQKETLVLQFFFFNLF